MKQTPEVLRLIAAVEAAHFRTVHDTGSNLNALCVWNTLRAEAGLPRLLIEQDLPAWDGKAYVMPPNSQLLANQPELMTAACRVVPVTNPASHYADDSRHHEAPDCDRIADAIEASQDGHETQP